MRLRSFSIWSALVVCCFGITGFAQDSAINAPVLGFIPDAGGAAIQPIAGVLGASVVEQPVVFGADFRDTVIAPRQDYALAIHGVDADVVVARFGADSITADALSESRPGAERIAISPTGTAAAVYGADGVVQVLNGLPDAPRVAFEFNASDIPGHLEQLTVADDATLALLNFATTADTALWAISSTGSRWLIAAQRPSAAAFIANRHDALIADDGAQEVFLIQNIDTEATRKPVSSFAEGFEAFSGVAASDDGSTVFVTSKSSAAVAVVNLDSGSVAVLSCPCSSAGLHRLKGFNVFRLSNPWDGPVAVLDASAAEPRIILLPVRQSSSVGVEQQ